MNLSAITFSSFSVRLRRGLTAIALGAALSGCVVLDFSSVPRSTSSALADPGSTRLGQWIAAQSAAQPKTQSGFVVLEGGLDAFVARATLADQAQRTLDVQTYILHADTAGSLLAARLWDAAERGVRVRLLIDDWPLADADTTLAALDAHPQIEVRLFNPRRMRGRYNPLQWLELIIDFDRLNRRMHNKLWAADNVAAIVGGRNIGDEYFEARDDLDFRDLDLLAAGPVVRELSTSFDRYWASEFAVPLAAVRTGAPLEVEAAAAQLNAARERAIAADGAAPFLARLEAAPLASAMTARRLPLIWGEAHAVVDAPDKLALGTDAAALPSPLTLSGQLARLSPTARRELLVVAPYFVPGDDGVRWFAALVEAGTTVRVLTNSLMSNDVVATQAGYARYRPALLRAGVQLYELKPTGPRIAPAHRASSRSSSSSAFSGSGTGSGGSGGSSRAALHEKSFVVDRRWVFVGSLNLDPRSVVLNTEIGVVVDSPALAERVAQIFERNTQPARAYRMRLAGHRVEWETEQDGRAVRLAAEPQASRWRRFMQGVYRVLAPDELL